MTSIIDCFACNNQDCHQHGHDVIPYSYCPEQPIKDRYERSIRVPKNKKCKTCQHRLEGTDFQPCGVCCHHPSNQEKSNE